VHPDPHYLDDDVRRMRRHSHRVRILLEYKYS
jgi:hypothetical protein